MLPFRTLIALISLSVALSAPSPPSYDEQFSKGTNGKDKKVESHQTERYLDLATLKADPLEYNIVPPAGEPDTCVVVCAMKPHSAMNDMRTGSANKDGYRQYACAPSCHRDVEDTSQPIKGGSKYTTPLQEGAKFGPADFEPNTVVVTFSGIARPGEKGNKDGFSTATKVTISCDRDQRPLDPNSSGGRADELELMAFACETYGGGPWAARVIDPFSVGRYNAIWMRESPVPIAAGVCGVRSQGNL